MAVPAFLEYAKLQQARQSPLQKTLGVLGTMQDLQAKRQTMEQQAALAPLIQQRYQQLLQEEPQRFTTEQRKSEEDIQKQSMANAASRLSNNELQYHIMKTDLADVYSAPKDQQQQMFDAKKKEWANVGIDTGKIPKDYDAETHAEAKLAYENSPKTMQARKDMMDIFKTQLQGRAQIESAMAKAKIEQAGKLPPQQEAFQKTEGEKNSAYFDTINTNADSAAGIYNQATKMIGTAGQIPKDLGLIKGGKVYFSPEGRELLANSRQLILKLFAQMPHIGKSGNLLLKFIEGSKPGVTMPYKAYVQVAKWYQAASKLAMEKNEMALVLKQHGITDRNRINSIWNRFQEAYPLSDEKGNVNVENANKWPEFLQNNPGVLTGFAGGGTQANVPPPPIAGKKLPGTVGSIGGTQTAGPQPQTGTQTTPLAQSPYFTSYNPYTGIGGQ